MPKYIIDSEATYEILKAVIPATFPAVVDRELIQCKDCKYRIVIPQFPDHPYCEHRLFGRNVAPDFFCADGERRITEEA